MTYVVSVLIHVALLCKTMRQHLVGTHGVSVHIHVPLFLLCHMLSSCLSMCRFSFVHVRLCGWDTWRQCGCFLFGIVSPRGSNTCHIYSYWVTCPVYVSVRVVFGLPAWRWRIVHVSVSYWATHLFLILVNVRFGPPRFQNLDCVHYMLTFI